MRSFENKRVLVTGSGRGIGKAIARRFAEDGAKLCLVARSQNESKCPVRNFYLLGESYGTSFFTSSREAGGASVLQTSSAPH